MSDALLVPLVVVGFAVVFPLFWMLVVGLIGRFGWGPLARAYPAEEWPKDGYKVSYQSAQIGGSSYSGAIHAVATPEGLYLRPMWLFRVGHPPVFVPWSAIADGEPAMLMGIRFSLDEGPRLVLFGKLAKAVNAAIAARDEASGAD